MTLALSHSSLMHFHSQSHSRPVRQRKYVRSLEQKQHDMTFPAYRQQILSDAAKVALSIYDMLGITGRFMFNDIWQLCREHGCEPLVSPALLKPSAFWHDWPGDISDFSDGGGIVLSAHMTFAESCAVMVHELTHRILYSGRIAEWALEHNHRRYDSEQWQEAVARAVERLFLEAGGTGLLPPRY